MTQARQIKGTLFKPWVVSIRANKSGIYDQYLSEEDKKYFNERILDSLWYPYEVFKKCFNAVCMIEAKENIEVIEKWGYLYGKGVLERIYKERLQIKELKTAVDSYNNLFKLWFNFGTQTGKIISDNEVHLSIQDFDKDFRLFYHISKGWMQGFFDAYLGTTVSAKFIEKSWEGSEKTTVKITWKS